jgi:hypothetical protein
MRLTMTVPTARTSTELAGYRGELAVLREEALARLRALFERDGKNLH